MFQRINNAQVAHGKRRAPVLVSQACAGFLLLVFGLSSHAQSDFTPSPDYLRCLRNADVVDRDILECMYSEMRLQELRLAGSYNNLLAHVSVADRREHLRNAQQLWQSYTKSNCSFYFDPREAKKSDRMMEHECVIKAHAARVDELESLDQWQRSNN